MGWRRLCRQSENFLRPVTRPSVSWGTSGSNPFCSTSESANFGPSRLGTPPACDTIRGSPNKFGLLGVLHNNTGSSNAQGLIDKSAGVINLLPSGLRELPLNSDGLDR